MIIVLTKVKASDSIRVEYTCNTEKVATKTNPLALSFGSTTNNVGLTLEEGTFNITNSFGNKVKFSGFLTETDTRKDSSIILSQDKKTYLKPILTAASGSKSRQLHQDLSTTLGILDIDMGYTKTETDKDNIIEKNLNLTSKLSKETTLTFSNKKTNDDKGESLSSRNVDLKVKSKDLTINIASAQNKTNTGNKESKSITVDTKKFGVYYSAKGTDELAESKFLKITDKGISRVNLGGWVNLLQGKFAFDSNNTTTLGGSTKELTYKLQANKYLSFDAYNIASQSLTNKKSQSKYSIGYTSKTTNFNINIDDFNNNKNLENLLSYLTNTINFSNTFGKALSVSYLLDTKYVKDKDSLPYKNKVSSIHVESDLTKVAIKSDIKRATIEDKEINSEAININAPLYKNFSMTGNIYNLAKSEEYFERNYAFGFDYTLSDKLKMTFLTDNKLKGDVRQAGRIFNLNGLLAKEFLGLKDITIGSSVNTKETNAVETDVNNSLKLQAKALGGTATLDNSEKLDPKTGIYYNSRILKYSKENKFIKLDYLIQHLTDTTGTPAAKTSINANINLGVATLGINSFDGKENKKGRVLPISGTTYRLSKNITPKTSIYTDYNISNDELCNESKYSIGAGVTCVTNSKTTYKVYYGLNKMWTQSSPVVDSNFNIDIDYILSKDYFIQFSVTKKSITDRFNIDPEEGNTIMRLDLNYLF
jgi:hypothetical protein